MKISDAEEFDKKTRKARKELKGIEGRLEKMKSDLKNEVEDEESIVRLTKELKIARMRRKIEESKLKIHNITKQRVDYLQTQMKDEKLKLHNIKKKTEENKEKVKRIYCPYCGTELAISVSSCPFCGANIENRILEIEKVSTPNK